MPKILWILVALVMGTLVLSACKEFGSNPNPNPTIPNWGHDGGQL